MVVNIVELEPKALRCDCDPDKFDFECTGELSPLEEVVGQDRALRAIEFGVGIKSHGYNIYALGPVGTGKTTFIKSFLQENAKKLPTPSDWCYIYDFSDPYSSCAIKLPAGKGAEFRSDMDHLLAQLKTQIPSALESEEFEQEKNEIVQKYQKKRNEEMAGLNAEAAEVNLALRASPTGLMILPAFQGQPLTPEQMAQMKPEDKKELDDKATDFGEKISASHRRIRDLEKETKTQVEKLEQDTVIYAVGHFIDDLKEKYAEFTNVVGYLKDVEKDVLDNVSDFGTPQQPEGGMAELPKLLMPAAQKSFNKYKVNLIVDNSKTEGAPVIVESNPTYANLAGRIDRQVKFGALTTDFTMIKGGAIHRANGGFLVIDAESLLRNMLSWEALKRVIENREIKISEVAQEMSLFNTISVEPEPIPVDIKIILIGSPQIYYILHDMDRDFQKQFKVMADFDTQMDRSEQNMVKYAKFICGQCEQENLLQFHRTAVAKVVEYSSELVGDQSKLSTRFIDVVDIVREASYWASQNGKERVYAEDVKKAIEEKIYRSNRIEKRLQEFLDNGTIMVDTEGAVVGQVNGLAVMQTGDHAFGKPARITARTFLGNAGVINIEREVKLSGRIHDKGMLILSGYLGSKYAQDKPISLSASICFEQSYQGVDGDSASSTELYALLSSIADVPLKQNIAVTGSVNQRGEIQPIGGVSHKIAGFFDVCKARGLTGDQGVMIPHQNVRNLMLRDDIVAAVAAGQFHVYPVTTVDQGIMVLTGVESGELQDDGTYLEGTMNYLIDKRLRELADKLKSYRTEGKEKKEEKEENEEAEGSEE